MAPPRKYDGATRQERQRQALRAFYERRRLSKPPKEIIHKTPEEEQREQEARKARQKARNEAWRKAHPEYRKKWYEQNIEDTKEANKAWRKANPEKRQANAKRYRESEHGKQWAEKYQARTVGKRWAHNIKVRYNLTSEEYHARYNAQKGCCAICGEYQSKLSVDHCHKTNVVRGLLCTKCNWILGAAHDRTSVLRAAIKYLQKYGVSEDDDNLRIIQLPLFESA